MFLRRTIGVGLALMLLTATATVWAQDDGPAARWGASVGTYIPTDSNTTDAFGSAWWSLNLNYDLTATPTDVHRLGIGWVQAPGDRLTAGGTTFDWEFRMVPLTYTYIKAPRGLSRGLFLGGGGGAYLNRTALETTVLGATSSQDETQTRFGLHALVGYSVTSRLAAELRFTKVFDDTDTGNVDGFTLALSGRF